MINTSPYMRSSFLFDQIGLDKDLFFQNIWQRKPCLLGEISVPEPLSKEGIHAILRNQRVQADKVRVVRRQEQPSPKEYSCRNGLANIRALQEFYRVGYSLVLPSLESYDSRIAHFCHKLTVSLGASVQANTYITPAGSQGFEYHWDNHDVLVMQVSGRKTWNIFDHPHAVLPNKDMRCVSKALDLSWPQSEVLMEKGHLLYIPRGFTHRAFTEDSDSIHVTFALEYTKVSDLLRSALETLISHEELLRLAIPLNEQQQYLIADKDLQRHISRIFETERLKSVLNDLQSSRTLGLTPCPSTFLEKTAHPSDGLYRLNKEAFYFLSADSAGSSRIVVPQAHYQCDKDSSELLREILTQNDAFYPEKLMSWTTDKASLDLFEWLSRYELIVTANS